MYYIFNITMHFIFYELRSNMHVCMYAGVDTKLMPITVFWHLNKITKNKTIKLISIDWTLKCKFIYWKFFVPSCLSSSWISSNKLRTLSISKSAAENPSIYKRMRKQIIENKLNNVMIYYLSLKKNYQKLSRRFLLQKKLIIWWF